MTTTPASAVLPPRLRSYGLTNSDLAASSTANLRETRADLLAAIERTENRDTLAIHRFNVAAVDAELARREMVTAAPAGYNHSPDGCPMCATIPEYVVDRNARPSTR